MNSWDNELTKYMQASEKKCHKFKQNQVDYSQEMALWWKRRFLLEWVRRYLMGKVQDPRNLIHDGRNIDTYPQQMTMQALDMKVFVVMKNIDELRLKAPEMHLQHLKN